MKAQAAGSPTRDRILELRRVSAAELRANPRNWRRHPETQARALRSVLEKVGYAGALLARETPDGLELIDGHLRQELAGSERVPVLVLDVDEEEAGLILATLDPLGAMAVTDEQALYDLLQSVQVPDDVLAQALEEMTGQAGPPTAALVDPDEAPDLPAEPITKPGDLWLLGPHRLLCADSTDPAAWRRLMGAEQADMVWTDPPYGVAYQTKLSKEEAAVRHRRLDGLEVANDALGEDGTADLLRRAFALALDATKDGGCWWVASPPGEMFDVFAQVLRELGLRRHTLVWVKDVFVMGRQDYHYRHESLFYGWKPGAAHREPPDRTQDTVWEIPRPRRSEEHPTMKPVELVARAISNHTLAGEIVVDPFLGSGTTLVAADQLSRVARGFEVDPAYCDVIVQRWEAVTGGTAVRETADADSVKVHG